MEYDSAVVGIGGNVYNWLSYGIVGMIDIPGHYATIGENKEENI